MGVTLADLDLRLVRYFVAVSTHRHFGRAAAELYISQPALSQAIAKLEKQLGVRLLDRDHRNVELTVAGEEFLKQARVLLEAADTTLTVARRARRDQGNVLHIGYIAAPGHLMSSIIMRAEAAVPDVTVETRRLEWRDQESAVATGVVDVSFARAPIAHPDLDHLTVSGEPLVVGVSRRHPLASRDSVTVADLVHEPILTSTSCPSEQWRLWWAMAHLRDGVPITWGPAVDTVEDMLEEISHGHGIAITATSVMRSYSHDEVRFLALEDAPPSTTELCWLRGSTMPVLQRFLAVAREVVAEQSAQPTA